MTSTEKRGSRYRERMATADSDRDRAGLEFDALRSEARDCLNAEQVWAEVVHALRAARTQLIPRRRRTS